MSNDNEYEFNDSDTSNNGGDDEYEFDFSEDTESDDFSEPVIILDDEESNTTSLDVIDRPNYNFTGTSEAVDGKVTIVHLDDEGNEHSQVIDLSSPELSTDEAKELTNTIKTQTNVLYLLIARAHAGKAHKALGYSSFQEYIKQEFNYSKSYAYKLLDQAKIIDAIEEVMPEGAQVYVSDATARGLKASMAEFIPELEEKVRDLPADDAAQVMEELVQDYRERREEEKNERDDNDDFDDDDNEFSGGGGGNGDYSGDFDVEEYEEEGEDEDAFGGEDAVAVRRRYEAVYNLYSALAQFTQMPSNEEIIKTIPSERQAQVTSYLDTSVNWLLNFKEDWYRDVVNVEGAENSDNNEENDSGEFEDSEEFNDSTEEYHED
jgi:hypothetical protein